MVPCIMQQPGIWPQQRIGTRAELAARANEQKHTRTAARSTQDPQTAPPSTHCSAITFLPASCRNPASQHSRCSSQALASGLADGPKPTHRARAPRFATSQHACVASFRRVTASVSHSTLAPPVSYASAINIDKFSPHVGSLRLTERKPLTMKLRCTASCSNTKKTGSCRPVFDIIRIITLRVLS